GRPRHNAALHRALGALGPRGRISLRRRDLPRRPGDRRIHQLRRARSHSCAVRCSIASGARGAAAVALDLAAMGTNSLDIRPLSGALGAEILGIDLSADVSDETVAAIRAAWLEHLVVFFRDQQLEPAQLLGVARRFGEPIEYPFVKGLDG